MQVFSQSFYLVSALLQNSGCMPCKLWIHALQFVDSCLACGIQILPEKRILDSRQQPNSEWKQRYMCLDFWSLDLSYASLKRFSGQNAGLPFRSQRTRAIWGCWSSKGFSLSGQQIPISSLWLKKFSNFGQHLMERTTRQGYVQKRVILGESRCELGEEVGPCWAARGDLIPPSTHWGAPTIEAHHSHQWPHQWPH